MTVKIYLIPVFLNYFIRLQIKLWEYCRSKFCCRNKWWIYITLGS